MLFRDIVSWSGVEYSGGGRTIRRSSAQVCLIHTNESTPFMSLDDQDDSRFHWSEWSRGIHDEEWKSSFMQYEDHDEIALTSRTLGIIRSLDLEGIGIWSSVFFAGNCLLRKFTASSRMTFNEKCSMVDTSLSYVLVTGATGLIGNHVVDSLLKKGIRVRAVVRSKQKAEHMLATRQNYASKLDFYFIDDLTTPGVFDEAVKDVDGVIHPASVSFHLTF